MSPLDIYNNTIVNNRLREIDIAFLEKIEYFRNHFKDIKSMPEELLKVINPEYKMTRNKKQNNRQGKSATELMIAYRINNQDNERSVSTARTNILDFRKFLNDSNIPDTIESMTKDIAARYAEWLKKQNILIKTANQRIRALATNLRNLTTILDINFEYPLPAKLPLLKETITGDELEDNDIALSEDQIETLYNLQGLSEDEAVARDIFCLQCWTGVRVSDVCKVLDSSNLKEIDGVKFTIFRPEKTKKSKNIRAIIPLTTIYPKAYEIFSKYQDNAPQFLSTRKNDYNELIRTICQIAKFDELREKTVETGKGKTTKKYKLWELMSSHKGRHTFATNCKRRGIQEDDIIKMTGHASTVQIKKTYDNTDAEDNARLLIDTLSGNHISTPSNVNRTKGVEAKPSFNPVAVLQRALNMLGGSIKNSGEINLVHIAQQLISKKAEIIKNYGSDFYQKLKETIMQGQSSDSRQVLERHLCKALKRNSIKLIGNTVSLSRLRW
ncbi:MAG: tyrosine-type recombinase/integrase [Muribaculaceae bacterium]